jgi:formylglycine-generating enzyme required for sulfatase activity
MTFAEVPEGKFRMGKNGFPLAHPVHTVTICGFWMAQTETTNGQYDQFCERRRFPESPSLEHPASRISWDDATAFVFAASLRFLLGAAHQGDL